MLTVGYDIDISSGLYRVNPFIPNKINTNTKLVT